MSNSVFPSLLFTMRCKKEKRMAHFIQICTFQFDRVRANSSKSLSGLNLKVKWIYLRFFSHYKWESRINYKILALLAWKLSFGTALLENDTRTLTRSPALPPYFDCLLTWIRRSRVADDPNVYYSCKLIVWEEKREKNRTQLTRKSPTVSKDFRIQFRSHIRNEPLFHGKVLIKIRQTLKSNNYSTVNVNVNVISYSTNICYVLWLQKAFK